MTTASTGTSTGRAVARWSALGCTVHVETARRGELERARELVAQVLEDVDAVASRFRADSDLSRVNRRPGSWVEVDPLLAAAVRVAVAAAGQTEGLVHPLLGRTLVELGYDRTFAELVRRPAADTPTPAPPGLDAWREIDVQERAIRIPDDTALDLGATAKAWCADLASTALADHLDGPAVVSVGGDLRTVGADSWDVGVTERPDDPVLTTVSLTGALATSSTRVRRWGPRGAERHHVVDPRTGAPADEVWTTVTVAATTCVAANTASTAAIVLGHAAAAWLEDRGVAAARLVGTDGSIQGVGRWPGPPREEDPR